VRHAIKPTQRKTEFLVKACMSASKELAGLGLVEPYSGPGHVTSSFLTIAQLTSTTRKSESFFCENAQDLRQEGLENDQEEPSIPLLATLPCKLERNESKHILTCLFSTCESTRIHFNMRRENHGPRELHITSDFRFDIGFCQFPFALLYIWRCSARATSNSRLARLLPSSSVVCTAKYSATS
jgi:hypothetical protein